VRWVSLLVCVVAVALASPAAGQNVNQVIVFGDSNVDSGWYRHPAFPPFAAPTTPSQATFNANILAAAASGGGKPTTGPGLVNSEVLALYFGLTALPANQPGGTNYATSGARAALDNTTADDLFTGDTPTTTQFNNYLAGNGGKANSNALYLIKTGDNDIAWALPGGGGGLLGNAAGQALAKAYLATQADALVEGIVKLKAAGARYIIVPNYSEDFGGALARDYRGFLGDQIWSGLAAAGVNFIPADFNAVRKAIDLNPGAFGFKFTDIDPAHLACGAKHALLCTPADLVEPGADQTYLFADAGGHFTTAGQKVVGDYYYSLVVAPSQISFLPETAVKTRTRLVSNIQTQIETTRAQPPGASGLNAWVTGDVSYLQMDNYPGFPDDPSTPGTLVAGLGFRSGGLIVGAAVSQGHLKSDFSGGRGHFKQDEIAGSAYAAFLGGPWWGTLVGTYGSLDYDVSRLVPIGITVQSNSGKTDGTSASVAAQAGFNIKNGPLTHGPMVGITWQRVNVDGFVETGSFTSLAFGSQTRDSAIGSLGWRASLDLGMFRPFGQLVWNHELAPTDRNVTASLTTTDAPSYLMPAVVLGKDWGTATVGANVILGPGVTGLAAFSTDFSQSDVVAYGAQIGINVAF
jgi:outer membrane lipase/esterase